MNARRPASPELLAVTDAYPPLKGGGTAYTYTAIAGLPYDVICLCPFGSVSDEHAVRLQRVFYTNFQIRNRYLRKVYSAVLYLQLAIVPLFWALRYRRRLRTVVCFQVVPAGIAGYLIRSLLRIPYVVVTYGEELTQALPKKVFGWRVHRWLCTLILSNAARVVTISDFTRNILAEFDVDRKRVSLIPPGIRRTSTPTMSDRLRRGLADHGLGGTRLVLMVSRLIERKGFDNAIRAVSEIADSIDGLRLAIVGEGEQEPFLKSLAREITRPEQVVFLGALPGDDVDYLYSMCDVFLLPVRSLPNGDTEGFGIVFVEAGLHGKPVVAGRAGATPEAVLDGVTGLLVDGSSVDAIKAGLLAVLNDTNLAARLGEAGRRRALEEFSIERQQARFNRMIQDVIGSPTLVARDIHENV